MTEQIAQRSAPKCNGSRKYTQAIRSFPNGKTPCRRRAKTSAEGQPQPFTMFFFELRAAGNRVPARIPFRIPRGFP